uniref:DNA-directed RNA polymerase n=1 Tax=Macrostomum lignano TaxID=282301 RepID=A0A1I8IJI8_9PLAT
MQNLLIRGAQAMPRVGDLCVSRSRQGSRHGFSKRSQVQGDKLYESDLLRPLRIAAIRPVPPGTEVR